MFQTLLVCVSFICYSLASFTVASGIFKAHGVNFTRVRYLTLVAVLTHLAIVSLQIFTPGGQDFSLINVISLVSLLISGSVSLTLLRFPTPFLLTVVYGFSAFILFSTLFFPHHVVVKHFMSNLPLAGHITLSLLAYCVLIIATLYALQFQYINAKIKSKDISVFSGHFPPLMQVERQQFQLLMIGTMLLSAALLSGFIYLDNMFSKSIAHKTVLSLMAWTIYVSLVLGHKYCGWRGRNAVVGTIVGAILLTLAYFGSRFVKEIILGRF